MSTLEGRSVVVVGASAGIGRAFAGAAHAAGADVVLAARRAEVLDQAVAALPGTNGVVTDITKASDCRRLAEESTAFFGRPIDLVFVAAGVGPMRRLVDLEVDEWRRVLETNVVGIHQTIRALLLHLAPGAVIAVLSSESAHQPRFGMGAYSASKIALEKLLDTWRVEHAPLRTSCITIGSTQPTEFGQDFDLDIVAAALKDWNKRGLLQSTFMETGEVGEFLVEIYGTALRFPGINIDTVVVRSPSPLPSHAPTAELTDQL